MLKKIIIFVIAASTLSACEPKKDFMAPCPDFGKHCQKVPINSWDFN